MGMSSGQVAAWKAAAGWNGAGPSDLKVFIASVVVILAFLWAGYIVKKLSFELASSPLGEGWLRFVLYLGRAIFVLIMLVWLVV